MRDTERLRVYAKRHSYLDANNEAASINLLEGDILRYLWDAGESQSVVALYGLFYDTRKQEQQAMVSPATLAMTLSGMAKKGLLHTAISSRRSSKGWSKTSYAPTVRCADVLPAILDAVSRRLTGQPLGYFLARLDDTPHPQAENARAGQAELEAVIAALQELCREASEERASPLLQAAAGGTE